MLKSRALTENKIAQHASINEFVTGSILTDLMLEGYIETHRKRRFMFFKRQYFTITMEGMDALEANRHPVERILNDFGQAVVSSIDKLADNSLPLSLVAWSLRKISGSTRSY